MSNLAVRLGREDRFVDLLEKLAPLAPGAGDVARVEAACSHEVFRHPSYFRILTHRWPQAKFVAAGLDGVPRRLAAGLGVAYASPSVPDGEESAHALAARESLLAHNFTFWEYLAYEVRRKFSRLKTPLGRGGRKASGWRQWALPGVLFLLALCGLFALGSYAFVTRTTVVMTPQVVARTASSNLVFAQDPDGFSPRTVPVRALEHVSSLSQTFAVNGSDDGAASRSSGLADLVNETGTGLRLRPSTRLVAPGGQVFRLADWTDVPAGATVRVRVASDLADSAGKRFGTGANVASGTLLALPGLGDLRDKAWARAAQDFTGATDERVPLLTQAELDADFAVLRDRLTALARDEVARQLATADANDPVASWAPLPAAGAATVLSFTGASDAATGAHVPQVTLSGSVAVRVLAYDRASAEVYLKTALFDRLLADRERFVALQPQTLRLPYEFSRVADPFRLRASAEMDASVAYTLADVAGDRAWAVKQEIAGKSVQEATAFLLADPEIASVTVSSSPFWADGVAPDPAHVRFVILRP